MGYGLREVWVYQFGTEQTHGSARGNRFASRLTELIYAGPQRSNLPHVNDG